MIASSQTGFPIEVDPSLGEGTFCYLVVAAVHTAEEFGVEPFPTPLRVIRAPSPDIPPQQRPNQIIITASANQNQMRLQLGHETFHWVCTPDYLHHWVHEMFAMEMSVRHLRRNGFDLYAGECDAEFQQSAESFPVERMVSESISPPYPRGLHDRAYVVGKELVDAVGWEKLKPLARSFDAGGQPDLTAWTQSLTAAERSTVERVLPL